MQILLASKLIAGQGHALCQQVSPTLGYVVFEDSASWDRQPGHKEHWAVGVTPCWHSAQLSPALGTAPVPCQHSSSLPPSPNLQQPLERGGPSRNASSPAHPHSTESSTAQCVRGWGVGNRMPRGPGPSKFLPDKRVTVKIVLPCFGQDLL